LRDHIFGAEFNGERKFAALRKLNSKKSLCDFFSLHSDIVSNVSNILSYDLTHTIGNFFHNIEPSDFISGTRKTACEGDFVISRLRSYLKEFAVVQANDNKQVFSSEYLIYRPITSELSSNTLVAYCLTKEVQTILNCSQYGTAHPRFYEFVFNELPIPEVLISLNDSIDGLLIRANSFYKTSIDVCMQAQNLLLETLGMKDFEISNEPINIKTFKESYGSSGRLDAEYYQLKFDELVQTIQETGNYDSLSNISSLISRGKQPVYTEGDKEGVFVLNSKHIRENKIIWNNVRNGSKEECDLFIKKGDVLMNGTGVGTIGRTAPYLNDNYSIPDNHITIIRTNDISPIFLSVFLNSIAGQLQVEKYFKGSSGQIELYPDDISNFLIWIAPKEVQKEIEEMILSAFELENQSNHLLEVAKRAVEIAIEEDEKVALMWVTEQTKDI